jgi:hypothetical protein
MPSIEKLQEALTAGLERIHIKKPNFDVYQNVGDGAVITGTFTGGHAVLVWDGRAHVDVNLFNLDDDIDIANDFNEGFTDAVEDNLAIGLRDDLPRGTGRVINFLEDLETPMPPQPKVESIEEEFNTMLEVDDEDDDDDAVVDDIYMDH